MAKVKANKKSRLNEKQAKILNIVVATLQILIIVASVVVSIFVILGAKHKPLELGKGLNMMVVLSDSMEGENKDSFSPGDMIFVKAIATQEDLQNLEVGQIVTYVGEVNGQSALISHRITKIEEAEDSSDGISTITTRGDKYGEATQSLMSASRVLGVYIGKIPKLGYAINWLQVPLHFFLVVVIPLALLLIYNVYLIIRLILENNKKRIQAKADAAITAAKESVNEEEIKKKAIEEYLASLNKKDDE